MEHFWYLVDRFLKNFDICIPTTGEDIWIYVFRFILMEEYRTILEIRVKFQKWKIHNNSKVSDIYEFVTYTQLAGID